MDVQMQENHQAAQEEQPTDAWGPAKEAQAILKCSRSTLYRWIRSGLVPAPRKVGPNKVLHNLTKLRHQLASSPAVPYAPQPDKAA